MAGVIQAAAVCIRVRSGTENKIGEVLQDFGVRLAAGPEEADCNNFMLIYTGLRIPVPEFRYIATRSGALEAHAF